MGAVVSAPALIHSEGLIREWAMQELGAQRCSKGYIEALAKVLGRMSVADTHGAKIYLKTVDQGASRQALRTILDQLQRAGYLSRQSDPKHAVYVYEGSSKRAGKEFAEDLYNRLQRDAEDAAFLRYTKSLGIYSKDVPF